LKDCKIWTRRFQSSNTLKDIETPLVMIHGMGAGLGFFCLNFDSLARDRTVYAIDLPGANGATIFSITTLIITTLYTEYCLDLT
jgi:pimeloyl-ACP methyl ester carboxylesterase